MEGKAPNLSPGIIFLNQKCPDGHDLPFEFVEPGKLQFCNGCLCVMKDEAFKCRSDTCDYILCRDCVKKPANFIGKAVDQLRAETRSKENNILWEDDSQFDDNGGVFGGYQENGYEMEGEEEFDEDDNYY